MKVPQLCIKTLYLFVSYFSLFQSYLYEQHFNRADDSPCWCTFIQCRTVGWQKGGRQRWLIHTRRATISCENAKETRFLRARHFRQENRTQMASARVIHTRGLIRELPSKRLAPGTQRPVRGQLFPFPVRQLSALLCVNAPMWPPAP